MSSHGLKSWHLGSGLPLHKVLDVTEACVEQPPAVKDHAKAHAHACTAACMHVSGFCWHVPGCRVQRSLHSCSHSAGLSFVPLLDIAQELPIWVVAKQSTDDAVDRTGKDGTRTVVADVEAPRPVSSAESYPGSLCTGSGPV